MKLGLRRFRRKRCWRTLWGRSCAPIESAGEVCGASSTDLRERVTPGPTSTMALLWESGYTALKQRNGWPTCHCADRPEQDAPQSAGRRALALVVLDCALHDCAISFRMRGRRRHAWPAVTSASLGRAVGAASAAGWDDGAHADRHARQLAHHRTESGGLPALPTQIGLSLIVHKNSRSNDGGTGGETAGRNTLQAVHETIRRSRAADGFMLAE